MQKPAPTTQNCDDTYRSSPENLERGRDAQPRWKDHPFYGPTSSHRQRYKNSPLPAYQLGKSEVILGYPWLTAFEPVIHWKDATLDTKYQPVVISSINPGETRVSSAITEDEWVTMNEDPDEVPYLAIRRIHSCAREPNRVGHEASSELE